MKRFASLALLASVALPVLMPAPVAAQSSGVEALLEQARYWEQRGRRDRAVEAYRRVLAIDPDNAAAKRGIQGSPAPAPSPSAPPAAAPAAAPSAPASSPAPAEPYRPSSSELAGRDRAAGFEALEAGNLGEAARRFEAALARRSNDPDSLGGLGLVRLRTEKFTEARDLLRRASRGGNATRWAEALRSAEFYAQLQEARDNLDRGRLAEAQRMAEALIASDFKETAPAYELLAAIYENQGRYMDAARMSDRAAQMSGADSGMVRRSQVNSLRQQALAARDAGDAMAAERLFQQGLLADTSDPWIRFEFARFLNDRGRVAEVDSLIRNLTQMGGTEATYAAALLLDRLGRTGEAQNVMAQIPANGMSAEMAGFTAGLQADAAIDRAKALASRGQTVQATTALRQIGNSGALPPGKMAEIAGVLYEMGDMGGASGLAQQALAANPTDAESYEPIIRVLAQTGQEAFALSALQRVNEAVGDSAQGAAMVARLNGVIAAVQGDQLREAGRYAESFELLQSAWNRAPGNVEILSALARLYQSGGLSLQAAQTFQLVLQQEPEDKGALIGLVDSAAAIGDFRLADQALRNALDRYPQGYEVYLAGARLEQARGDEGDARDYLKRARDLYMRQSGMAAGGFPSANPFANMRGPMANNGGLASVNPFALGTNPDMAKRMGADMSGPAYGSQMPASYGAPQGGFGAPSGAPMSSSPMSPSGAFGGSYGYASAAPGAAGYGNMPGYPAQSAAPMGSRGPVLTGDPVLDGIQQDLQDLAAESGPRLDVHTNYRNRSGEEGLSALQEIGATAEISTDFAGGRISAKGKALVIDAGRPTGSGLARFGRNGTIEAQAIVDEEEADLVDADTQHASGIALSVGYKSDLIEAEAGTTPIGFGQTRFAGRFAVTPRFSPYASGRVWVERRPVDDSVIAYAGTEDPVSGEMWGAVMRTGGGVSFSWDRDGTGFYADGSYNRYAGTNVRDNESIQLNAGGYFRGYQDETSNLTFGVNANYQSFDNNQNYFTFGHGGYFSPQSFLSIGFPIRYSYSKGPLEANASVTPGFQSYEQRGEGLYPTDPAAQSALDALRAENSDVRARYDTISRTGFGMAADGSLYYRVSPRTQVGGEFEYNSFGDYNEFLTLLGVRQQFGSGE